MVFRVLLHQEWGKENHYDALDHRAAVGGHHCRPHVHPGVEMAGVDGTVAFRVRVGAQSFFWLSGLRYSHGDTDAGSVHNPGRDSYVTDPNGAVYQCTATASLPAFGS